MDTRTQAAIDQAEAVMRRLDSTLNGEKTFADDDDIQYKIDGNEEDFPSISYDGEVEEKVVRFVRTAAGARRFGQPIGTVIVRDGVNLSAIKFSDKDKSPHAGWVRVSNGDGKRKFEVGKYDDGKFYIAEDDDWDKQVGGAFDSMDDALEHLNGELGGKKKGSAPKDAGPKKPFIKGDRVTMSFPEGSSNFEKYNGKSGVVQQSRTGGANAIVKLDNGDRVSVRQESLIPEDKKNTLTFTEKEDFRLWKAWMKEEMGDSGDLTQEFWIEQGKPRPGDLPNSGHSARTTSGRRANSSSGRAGNALGSRPGRQEIMKRREEQAASGRRVATPGSGGPGARRKEIERMSDSKLEQQIRSAENRIRNGKPRETDQRDLKLMREQRKVRAARVQAEAYAAYQNEPGTVAKKLDALTDDELRALGGMSSPAPTRVRNAANAAMKERRDAVARQERAEQNRQARANMKSRSVSELRAIVARYEKAKKKKADDIAKYGRGAYRGYRVNMSVLKSEADRAKRELSSRGKSFEFDVEPEVKILLEGEYEGETGFVYGYDEEKGVSFVSLEDGETVAVDDYNLEDL